jgi:hypothetical protein
MCGRTLRSSRWRTPADSITLNHRSRHVFIIQLQGHLFFGNATLLAEVYDLSSFFSDKSYSLPKRLVFLILILDS